MGATTTLAMSGPLVLAVLVSVAAGLVSFASPCVVPLVPVGGHEILPSGGQLISPLAATKLPR